MASSRVRTLLVCFASPLTFLEGGFGRVVYSDSMPQYLNLKMKRASSCLTTWGSGQKESATQR